MPTLIEKYRKYLPLNSNSPLISIGEGDTPLVHSQKLEKELDCGELHFKLEGCNPTGSFKDRGMVLAVLVPKGNIALGKLAQSLTFGARVISIDGNFDQALQMVQVLTGKHPIALVNSINPFRIEGQKTAAFEIVDSLGDAPDYLFIPVGNAGNITAYWRGFVEYKSNGIIERTPRMMGFEAEGAAAIVHNKVIQDPETVATAIRIGNPASWSGATAARDESGGVIDFVNDTEIMDAYTKLATVEGIFGEPASAAALAGLIKHKNQGLKLSDKKIVCVITGTGLKDPDIALHQAKGIIEAPADFDIIERIVLDA
jgi:threonine synthase